MKKERVAPMEKNDSGKYFKIFIAILVSAFCKNSGAGGSAKSKIWKSKKVSGFSVSYHECWRTLHGETSEFDDGQNVFYQPTGNCPKSERGKWTIELIPPPDLSGIEVKMGPRPPPPEGSFITKMMSDGIQMTLYQLHDSNMWFAEGKCDVKVFYSEDEDTPPEKEKASRHIVPPVFKEFVKAMRCQPPK